MKPYKHAKNSANKFGGVPEDYQRIHDFIDSSKSSVPDMRHRAQFHHAFGIYTVEAVFGTNMMNSDGKLVSVRDIAEDHVIEDLGYIPTLEDWIENMELKPWMSGEKRRRFIPID